MIELVAAAAGQESMARTTDINSMLFVKVSSVCFLDFTPCAPLCRGECLQTACPEAGKASELLVFALSDVCLYLLYSCQGYACGGSALAFLAVQFVLTWHVFVSLLLHTHTNTYTHTQFTHKRQATTCLRRRLFFPPYVYVHVQARHKKDAGLKPYLSCECTVIKVFKRLNQ